MQGVLYKLLDEPVIGYCLILLTFASIALASTLAVFFVLILRHWWFDMTRLTKERANMGIAACCTFFLTLVLAAHRLDVSVAAGLLFGPAVGWCILH